MINGEKERKRMKSSLREMDRAAYDVVSFSQVTDPGEGGGWVGDRETSKWREKMDDGAS